MYKDLCCFEGNWRDTVSTGTPNSTRTLRAYCTNVRRVQKLKCNVVSHASKHKPDSHILPYWSDRICRKLAENTNTAWGDCLKLETSFLSTLFSCSGNHLAVHAYQAFFLETWVRFLPFSFVCCFVAFNEPRSRKFPANLSLCNPLWSLFCRHFCFGGGACLCHSAGTEASLFSGLSSTANPHFQSAQNRSQVSSVADNYSGTVTGIPSPVIPGWPLLRLSAIQANNTAQ